MESRKLSQEIISRLRSGFSISSVAQSVNELVLNSLDAKSKNIAVRINLQTFRFQVVDDGEGIPEDNLQWAGTRYMTNKCHTLNDFEKISKFYGFKGESLASIKEHAKRIIISTKCFGFETFSKTLDSNGDDVVVIKNRPSHGTTITVEDFLYNLPIRRNVVNPDLELNAIRSNLEVLSIIHPSISFTLRNDVNRKLIFTNSKCDSVEFSLINLYPRLKSEKFGALKLSSQLISVIGLIYKELVDIKAQYVYVNKRAVECNALHRLIFDELVNSAIYKKERKETFCYLFNLKCPNSKVDFSVQGSKTFAEFREWDAVVRFMHKFLAKFLKREGLELALREVEEIARKVPSIRDVRLSAMGGACKSKIAKRTKQMSSVDLNKAGTASIAQDSQHNVVDLNLEETISVRKIGEFRGIKKKGLKKKVVNKSVKKLSVYKEEKVTFNSRMRNRKLAKQLILSASKIDKNVFRKLFSGRISDDETSNREDNYSNNKDTRLVKHKSQSHVKTGACKKSKLENNFALETSNVNSFQDAIDNENVDEDKTYVTTKSVDTFWNINNQKIGKAMVMEKFLKSIIMREECPDEEVSGKMAASVSIKIRRKTVEKFDRNCKPSMISTMSFTQMISVKNEFLSNGDYGNLQSSENFQSVKSPEFCRDGLEMFDEEFDFVEDFRLDPNFTKPILKKHQDVDGFEFNNRFNRPENMFVDEETNRAKNCERLQFGNLNTNFTKPILKRSKGNYIVDDFQINYGEINLPSCVEDDEDRYLLKKRYGRLQINNKLKGNEENVSFEKRFKEENLRLKNVQIESRELAEPVLSNGKGNLADENAFPRTMNNAGCNFNRDFNAFRGLELEDFNAQPIPPVEDYGFMKPYEFEDHKHPGFLDQENVRNHCNNFENDDDDTSRDYYNNIEDKINNINNRRYYFEDKGYTTHKHHFNLEDVCNLGGEGVNVRNRHFNHDDKEPYGRNIQYKETKKNFQDEGTHFLFNHKHKEDCVPIFESQGYNAHHMNLEDKSNVLCNTKHHGHFSNLKDQDYRCSKHERNNLHRRHSMFDNDEDVVPILEKEDNEMNVQDREYCFRNTKNHHLNLPGCSKNFIGDFEGFGNTLHKRDSNFGDTAIRKFSIKNKLNLWKDFPRDFNQKRHRNMENFQSMKDCHNYANCLQNSKDFPNGMLQQNYPCNQFTEESYGLTEDGASVTDNQNLGFTDTIIQAERSKKQCTNEYSMKNKFVGQLINNIEDNMRNLILKKPNLNFRNEFAQKQKHDFPGCSKTPFQIISSEDAVNFPECSKYPLKRFNNEDAVNRKTDTKRPFLDHNLQQFSRNDKFPRYYPIRELCPLIMGDPKEEKQQFVRKMSGFEKCDILQGNQEDFRDNRMNERNQNLCEFINAESTEGQYMNNEMLEFGKDFTLEENRRYPSMNQDQTKWMNKGLIPEEHRGLERDPKELKDKRKVGEAVLQHFRRYRSEDNSFRIENPRITKERINKKVESPNSARSETAIDYRNNHNVEGNRAIFDESRHAMKRLSPISKDRDLNIKLKEDRIRKDVINQNFLKKYHLECDLQNKPIHQNNDGNFNTSDGHIFRNTVTQALKPYNNKQVFKQKSFENCLKRKDYELYFSNLEDDILIINLR